MTDRIADIWGERTTFGAIESWPVRVDQFLEEGISESEVDRWVQKASVMSSNDDALGFAVKDGRIVGVRGRAVDRVNHGRLGPKNLYAWQSSSSEDRPASTLVREDGKLVEASWDEAMERIVERSKRQLEEKGRWIQPVSATRWVLGVVWTGAVAGRAGLVVGRSLLARPLSCHRIESANGERTKNRRRHVR